MPLGLWLDAAESWLLETCHPEIRSVLVELFYCETEDEASELFRYTMDLWEEIGKRLEKDAPKVPLTSRDAQRAIDEWTPGTDAYREAMGSSL